MATLPGAAPSFFDAEPLLFGRGALSPARAARPHSPAASDASFARWIGAGMLLQLDGGDDAALGRALDEMLSAPLQLGELALHCCGRPLEGVPRSEGDAELALLLKKARLDVRRLRSGSGLRNARPGLGAHEPSSAIAAPSGQRRAAHARQGGPCARRGPAGRVSLLRGPLWACFCSALAPRRSLTRQLPQPARPSLEAEDTDRRGGHRRRRGGWR